MGVLQQTEDDQQSDHFETDRQEHFAERRPRDADLTGTFRAGLTPPDKVLAVASDQVVPGQDDKSTTLSR